MNNLKRYIAMFLVSAVIFSQQYHNNVLANENKDNFEVCNLDNAIEYIYYDCGDCRIKRESMAHLANIIDEDDMKTLGLDEIMYYYKVESCLPF